MQQDKESPLYHEYHEAFRRLLLAGGVSFVVGFFFSQGVGFSVSALKTWSMVAMFGAGALAMLMCFVLYPKQYSIYSDSLVVEWWYGKRKRVPYDKISELRAWNPMGKRNLIVVSRYPNYNFDMDYLAPRKMDAFAERLEEAINRHRFFLGREPIQIRPEDSDKDKKAKKKE